MFHRKKKTPSSRQYDPSVCQPVLRCSICTGEQVAGFRRLDDGKFEEVMLVRNDADLAVFREDHGRNREDLLAEPGSVCRNRSGPGAELRSCKETGGNRL